MPPTPPIDQTVPFADRIAALTAPISTDAPAPESPKTSFADRIYNLMTTTPAKSEDGFTTSARTPVDKFLGRTIITRDDPKPYSFDRADFAKRIVGVENEALVGNEPAMYKSIGETGDLGKYQASPATVATWSKAWLGKKYTKEQFLNDPKAQDAFFNEFNNVVEKYKLSPEEAAVTWHRGWGDLGQKPKDKTKTKEQVFRDGLAEAMKDPENQRYLGKFSRQITSL